VYRTPTYHASSSCDDHEIIKEFKNEKVVEKDALDMCVTHDVVFHYAEALKIGHSWATPLKFHTIG